MAARKEEMDKITGFFPGIVKIPSSVQVSRFTTTWLSSGIHNSSKVVENSAHFKGISQQKQTWRPPRSGSGHVCKKGDNSCQESLYSGILQQTISGTQTYEKVETSDRFKYVKQPFTCTDRGSGSPR